MLNMLILIALLCACWKKILAIICVLFTFIVSGLVVIISKIRELREEKKK